RIELLVRRRHAAEDTHGFLDRLIAEPAVVEDARAKPRHFAFGCQYSWRRARDRLGCKHSRRIAPNVDRGITKHPLRDVINPAAAPLPDPPARLAPQEARTQ